MKLSEEELAVVRKHESSFVSFHYLDNIDGVAPLQAEGLRSIEVSTSSLSDNNLNANEKIFLPPGVSLQPIKGKFFKNNFRTHPTTSFYCDNNLSPNNYRQQLVAKLKNYNISTPLACFYAYQFCLMQKKDDDLKTVHLNHLDDPYVNFRTDCIDYLQAVNINAHSSFYSGNGVSTIIFSGNDLLDLLDNCVLVDYIGKNIARNYGFCSQDVNIPENRFYFENNNSSKNLLKLFSNAQKVTNEGFCCLPIASLAPYKAFLALFD